MTIQSPQLDINTVAAGGGSCLTFENGLFKVGPESAGAHPGPACERCCGNCRCPADRAQQAIARADHSRSPTPIWCWAGYCPTTFQSEPDSRRHAVDYKLTPCCPRSESLANPRRNPSMSKPHGRRSSSWPTRSTHRLDMSARCRLRKWRLDLFRWPTRVDPDGSGVCWSPG